MARLLTATVIKRFPEDDLGLRFATKDDGSTIIVDVASDSPFVVYQVVPGVQVLTVNNVDATSAEDALQTVLQASDTVTLLVARPPNATVTVAETIAAAETDANKFKVAENQDTTPTTVTVTRRVASARTRGVGILLVATGPKLCAIDSIEPDSPFYGSELQPGMELLSVNGWKVPGQTVKSVIRFMQATPDGESLTVVACRTGHHPSSGKTQSEGDTVSNQVPASSSGLSFDRTSVANGETVSPGAAAQDQLRANTITISTERHAHGDGQNAPADLNAYAGMKKISPSHGTSPTTVKVTRRVESARVRGVGISLVATGPKVCAIDSIDPYSPFYGSELQPGMELLSVNGWKVPGQTVKSVIRFMQATPDGESLTVVACRKGYQPPGTFGGVYTVSKQVQAASSDGVGLSFETGQNGALVVNGISQTSPFYDTDIKPGHQVLSLNGMNVRGWTPENATRLLRNTPDGLFTVTAISGTSTRIVHQPEESEPDQRYDYQATETNGKVVYRA